MANEGKTPSLDDVVKPEAEAVQPEKSALPDKYAGKSVEDIVRMHQEAEKLIGRQAGELGDLRKWADTLIQTNLKDEPKKEEEPDFFIDPKAAVKRTLETDPTIKATLERTRAIEARLNQESLEKKHPDYTELLNDSGFQEWVGSSKYRTQLFKTANDNWDFDAADELFSTYKAIKPKAASESPAPNAALKRASVPSGGASVDADAGEVRKVYRRADIIKLMQTDPKRYQALQPDIMKAYQEGRVR